MYDIRSPRRESGGIWRENDNRGKQPKGRGSVQRKSLLELSGHLWKSILQKDLE